MNREKNIMARMKKEDPIRYAGLCEQSGYRAEALKVYSNSNDPTYLCKAAELALELKRYNQVRPLLKKARERVDQYLESARASVNAVQMDPEGRGLMGAAMSFWNTEDTHKKILREISALEAKL